MNFIINLPIILTLLRLVFSIIILPILFVIYSIYNLFFIKIILVLLFTLLALTDFLDGYLARKYNQTTSFGAMLDPLADKLLVSCILIFCVYFNKIYFFWAIIFFAREFWVMALREMSLIIGFRISVDKYGKIKTCCQFIYLILALIDLPIFYILENISLFLALFSSLYSGYIYTKKFYLKSRELKK